MCKKSFLILSVFLAATLFSGCRNQTSDTSSSEDMDFGYVRQVSGEDGNSYMEVDFAEWFSGDEAEKAAIEDTGCAAENITSGECAPSLNNGFYIRNTDGETVRLLVAADFTAHLDTIIYTPEIEKYNLERPIDFATLQKIFTENPYFQDRPYWLEIDNGRILKISQQYIP